MGAPDPRVGGFGPFFALETMIAVLAAGAVTVTLRGRGIGDLAFVIALGLAAITAIFPEPWWARFAPFFWGVPIFLALGAGESSALTRWGAVVVLALALVNGGIALAGNLARTALGDYRMRALLSDLAAQSAEILIVPVPYRGFQFTAAHRLAGAGIAFRIGKPELPIGDSSPQCARVLRTDRIRYCLPAEVLGRELTNTGRARRAAFHLFGHSAFAPGMGLPTPFRPLPSAGMKGSLNVFLSLLTAFTRALRPVRFRSRRLVLTPSPGRLRCGPRAPSAERCGREPGCRGWESCRR